MGRAGPGRPRRLVSGRLTSLTRCPGVLEIAQVHSFLLGYLSGQLGLVMVPLVDVTLWSQPAVGGEREEGDQQGPQHSTGSYAEGKKVPPSRPPRLFFLLSPM